MTFFSRLLLGSAGSGYFFSTFPTSDVSFSCLDFFLLSSLSDLLSTLEAFLLWHMSNPHLNQFSLCSVLPTHIRREIILHPEIAKILDAALESTWQCLGYDFANRRKERNALQLCDWNEIDGG